MKVHKVTFYRCKASLYTLRNDALGQIKHKIHSNYTFLSKMCIAYSKFVVYLHRNKQVPSYHFYYSRSEACESQ